MYELKERTFQMFPRLHSIQLQNKEINWWHISKAACSQVLEIKTEYVLSNVFEVLLPVYTLSLFFCKRGNFIFF